MTTFPPYETKTTQFKREPTFRDKSGRQADTMEKEVVVFLHSPKGGSIYIKVEDDGTIVGVPHPAYSKDVFHLSENFLELCCDFDSGFLSTEQVEAFVDVSKAKNLETVEENSLKLLKNGSEARWQRLVRLSVNTLTMVLRRLPQNLGKQLGR